MKASSMTTVSSTSESETLQAVVYFRIPHARVMKKLVQHTAPRTFMSLKDIPLTGGYAIMPFGTSADCPLVFIEPDKIEELPIPVPQLTGTPHPLHTDEEVRRTDYHQTFTAAHGRLTDGEVQKMVLSRRLHVTIETADKTETESLESLLDKGYDYFLRACHYRPNSYVAFWWTPATGAWLIATPEPILEQHRHDWGTVALAGTIPWIEGAEPEWNEKNKEEQAIVRRFITNQLENLTTDLKISETYSLHTGNIQHLCTDFNFGLKSEEDIREVLMRLHPTPAVCGLPREEARQAILHDESSPRRYYAGFSGPLHLQGETHLYVSLRCMEFTTHSATLYAGGGLMPESQEADEWEETRRKMQTMWQLL